MIQADMREEQQLYFGNVDGTVGELLRSQMGLLPSSTSVLIRSLDSDRRPENLAKYLGREGFHGKVLQPGVLFARSQLEGLLARPGVFTNFDEIWLVSDVDEHVILPKTVVLTSSVDRFQRGLSPELVAAFSVLRCCLAVADGNDGLNYVTTDEAFAAMIDSAA
jgi:hypothetical protein